MFDPDNFKRALTEQTPAYPSIDRKDRIIRGEDQVAILPKAKPYDPGAAYELVDLARRRYSEYSAPAGTTGSDVQISFHIECDALRPAKSSNESLDPAFRVNGVDRIKAGQPRRRYIQPAIGAERHMICRDRRFKPSEHFRQAEVGDTMDRACPVANIKNSVTIESNPGGYSKSRGKWNRRFAPLDRQHLSARAVRDKERAVW